VNGRGLVLDRELDQRTSRGGRNCMSNSGGDRGGCGGGNSMCRAGPRMMVEPSTMTPACPWQCPDPFAQQPGIWFASLTIDTFAQLATRCCLATCGALGVICVTRAAELVPIGQACEASTVTNASKANVARTRATRQSQRPAPCAAFLVGRRRPFHFGVRQANMPRSFGAGDWVFSKLLVLDNHRAAGRRVDLAQLRAIPDRAHGPTKCGGGAMSDRG